jgi:DNA-binding beta-propeller fold protein YncE
LDDYGFNNGDYTYESPIITIYVVCGNEVLTPSTNTVYYAVPLGGPYYDLYLSPKLENAFTNTIKYDPATIVNDIFLIRKNEVCASIGN